MLTRWELRTAAGQLVAIKERRDLPDRPKEFRLRGADGTLGLGGRSTADLPLYGSERIAGCSADATIVIVEGEKAADALTGVGVFALGTGGASVTPSPAVLGFLAGRHVVLWPDADEPGRQHMSAIAERLRPVAASVRIATWTKAPAKGDAADYVAAGGDPWTILDAAGPDAVDPPAPATVVVSAPRAPERPWPDPPADARHGLVGAFLAAVEPHSEADPAALGVEFLVAVGAMVGPGVFARAGDAEHPPRTNVLIVGDTATSRKGSSMAPVRCAATMAEPEFAERIASGLSTGEGLIYAVRDAVEHVEDVGRGADRHPELVVIDAGVEDKRLLVVESEFASVLRRMQRDGNSLSSVVRLAWDSGNLSTLTRTNPLRATGAHITIVGQITRDELLRYLDRTELANGFVNRFLIVAARRSRVLPDGEGVPASDLRPVAEGLGAAIEWARKPHLLRRDPTAAEMWRAIYPDLSAGRPGMLGAATNRAEAQVLRLSVLYAVLDRSPEIRPAHLLAALDVWRICDASAYWAFGDATGDPIADTILGAIRARGALSRTDVRDLFDRHASRAQVERAISRLVSAGRIVVVSETTGGRPREVLRAP